MSYLHYHSSHTRDHSPHPRQHLIRRNSKRQRLDLYSDDDEHDDYPYASKQPTPSRALTIRQPSQLVERYNIWSPQRSSPRRDSSPSDTEDRSFRYKYTTTRSTRPTYSADEDEDEREREFRLRVRASFGRPKSAHHSSHDRSASSNTAMAWHGDAFRRRERWEDEDWKVKVRERGVGASSSFWDEEPRLKERTVRYRKIKRTRTDEWKPLSGFRRS